jgi:hypothetical protein
MLKRKRREYYEGCLKLLDVLAQRSPDFEAASVEDTSGGKD